MTKYDDEEDLEALLAESPELLPGTGGSMLALARQLPAAGGAADLIGVDAEGNIVIVECKLRKNPEIRREVVGQIFAYASAIWRFSYEDFDRAFRSRTGRSLAEAAHDLADTEGWSEESFREKVAENLHAGRFGLVLAVDEITDELKLIVEYLNDHLSDDVEVTALEVAYVEDGDVKAIVPRTYGEKRAYRERTRVPRTIEQFRDALHASGTPGEEAVLTLMRTAESRGAGLNIGTGRAPSLSARFVIDGRETSVWTCWVSESGSRALIVPSFAMMKGLVAPERLRRYAEGLRRIPSFAEKLVGLEEAGYGLMPNVPLATLADSDALHLFEEAVRDLVGESGSGTLPSDVTADKSE